MNTRHYFEKRDEDNPEHPAYFQKQIGEFSHRMTQFNSHEQLRKTFVSLESKFFNKSLRDADDDMLEMKAEKQYHVPSYSNPSLHMAGVKCNIKDMENSTRLPNVTIDSPGPNSHGNAGSEACALLCKTGNFTFKSRSNPFTDFTRNSGGQFDRLEPASFNISRNDMAALSTDHSAYQRNIKLCKGYGKYELPCGPGVGKYNTAKSKNLVMESAPRFSLSGKEDTGKQEQNPGPLLPDFKITKPGVLSIKMSSDKSLYKDYPREAFMGSRLGVGPATYNSREPDSRSLHVYQSPAFQTYK